MMLVSMRSLSITILRHRATTNPNHNHMPTTKQSSILGHTPTQRTRCRVSHTHTQYHACCTHCSIAPMTCKRAPSRPVAYGMIPKKYPYFSLRRCCRRCRNCNCSCPSCCYKMGIIHSTDALLLLPIILLLLLQQQRNNDCMLWARGQTGR